MAKASQPGRTKTRLSPPFTPIEAAEFNTAFLKDIAESLLLAAGRVSLSGCVAYGPPGAAAFFHAHLPAGIGLREIWFPDFGDCLMRALEAQFAAGHSAACVLNSDSPTLPVEILCETAEILAAPGDRIVLGPSCDGGYYLLGCKRMHPRLFEDIAWSTGAVAEQTLARAAELGLQAHLLPQWYDVDDCQSLRVLHDELLEDKPFNPLLRSGPARHTADLLAGLRRGADLGRRLQEFEAAAMLQGRAASLQEAAA